MTIIASADGSALGNPGPAGWAWYIDPTSWKAGGWAHGTNNMGELTAVLSLLEETRHRSDEPLHVLCDSQYVINSVTKWMPGWKKKGWKKRDGKPVLNVDIMKALDAELSGRDVTFEWVKGHAGHELNEAADERARAMAVAYQKRTDPARMPVGPGFRDHAAGAAEPAADPVAPAITSSAATNSAPAGQTGAATTSAPADPIGAAQASTSRAQGATGRAQGAALRAPDEEPDLFSELALAGDTSHRAGEPGEPADQDGYATGLLAEAVTRETTVAGADPRHLGAVALLHPDVLCIDATGRSLTGEAVLEVLRSSGAVHETQVTAMGSGAYHLSYRSEEPAAVTRRSSVWVREDQHNEMGPWLLRYHQVTEEH